jgi:membrane fusion protein, multidrug efflux system
VSEEFGMSQQIDAPPALLAPGVPATGVPAPAPRTSLLATVARLAVFVIAGAALLLVLTHWNEWVGAAGAQSTDDAYLQADLTPVSARVAGYLRSVPVADFQRVHAGDLLAEILDDDYKAQVLQAEASVSGAEAAIAIVAAQRALQQANIQAAQATIVGTSATLERYRAEAARQHTLIASGIAGTRQAVETADANNQQTAAILEQNHAQLEAARRQLNVYDAQEKQAQATLAAQRAALSLAQLNLGYTRITAPADGMVGQRQVRPGQFVTAGTQVLSLVPLPHVWVVANYKETQLTHLAIGQKASVTVDTFPGSRLAGHVDSYAPASGAQFSLLPADNATGNFTKVVQRIPVKIVIDDAGPLTDKLRPGMSVVATIDTASPGTSPGAAPGTK